ncbi:MAG TPA: C45 family peptidase [Kofleriaceae bacterium]|jgi:hypothetical protein
MPDLVIGARRSAAFPRPWRAAGIAIAMVGVAIVVAWFIYKRSVVYEMPGGQVHGELTLAPGAPGARATLELGSAASLEWVGGLAVLRATGDAHAIGAAHGRLLAPLLPAVIDAARPSVEATITDEGILGHTTHAARLAWRWRFIDDGMSEADRDGVAGMTRGAAASGIDVSFDDLLRDQAVLDVGAPAIDSGERVGLARSLTIVAPQTETARVWIGRAVALPGLADGGDAEVPVVTIAHPDGHIAWASVGWPGQIGVVTGVNAQGIAVMVNPVRTVDAQPTRVGRPVALLARMVLEQAKTLDEAVKLVEQTPTLGAAAFVIADGQANKWLVVERTPSKAIVEKTPKLPVVGDLLTTNALASDPENDRAKRLYAPGRVERAARLVRQPLPDVSSLATILRDDHGVDDAPRPPGHRGVIDDGRAVQTAILDPATLELWVADPTAAGRMRAFDLRHELRGDGDHPAPPADIAADPTIDPDRKRTLAAARAELRTARLALHDGAPVRASEACARARARVPLLPEALEVCALAAQARGDHSAAQLLYQQWLDGGADDPNGEERAHALLAR